MSFEEDILARIEVRGKLLLVIYNKCLPGLYSRGGSDDEIGEYIRNNTDEAFLRAIQLHQDGYYVLNIASVENFAAFHWKDGFAKSLLARQMEIYNPLIQEFVCNSTTRTWNK